MFDSVHVGCRLIKTEGKKGANWRVGYCTHLLPSLQPGLNTGLEPMAGHTLLIVVGWKEDHHATRDHAAQVDQHTTQLLQLKQVTNSQSVGDLLVTGLYNVASLILVRGCLKGYLSISIYQSFNHTHFMSFSTLRSALIATARFTCTFRNTLKKQQHKTPKNPLTFTCR